MPNVKGHAFPKIIAIVGPTASGKTDVALAIAHSLSKSNFDKSSLGGEIILPDSRQIYRGTDFATNKVRSTNRRETPHKSRGLGYTGRTETEPTRNTPNGRGETSTIQGVPYHGLDLVEPDDVFTVSQWKTWAEKTISEILERGWTPIIEGGTGLYVSALLENWQFPPAKPDPALREHIEERIAREGVAAIAKEVLERDSEAAAFLDIQNPRRGARALEVIESTRLPFSAQRTKGERKYDALVIGIARPLEDIDKRIEARAAQQFDAGLEDEARAMLKKYGDQLPAMTSIGYIEWQDYFDGTISRDDVLVRNIKRNRDLARAQLKWWKKNPTIRWVQSETEAVRNTEDFLKD